MPALWGIRYMDLDERWWIDLALRSEAPPVRYVVMGSRQFCDGFDLPEPALLARRVSVAPEDCADWPADEPVRLGPAPR
jgi:hypothetical protein